jgi:hypothetical protein
MAGEAHMRICQGLLCDNAADLYWHGPWCGRCADQRYGRVPMFVGQLEMSRRHLSGGSGGTARVPSSVLGTRPRRPEAEGISRPLIPAPVATSYDVEPDWLDAEFVALLEADV